MVYEDRLRLDPITQLSRDQVDRFIEQHQLPGRFHRLVEKHYSQLVSWLFRQHQPGEPLFIGINGAQGTGKSTLAAYLKLALECNAGWRVAVLSIDDFYLTQAEREQLADLVHPLLKTRGVPGTHDLRMLAEHIRRLKTLPVGETMALPRFNKSTDDRARSDDWPSVTGPIDLIILEGWCVGSVPESNEALSDTTNSLEEKCDTTGEWRQYINDRLKGPYADIFSSLEALIFLKAPDFDAVFRWRLEQEQKLAESTTHQLSNTMSRQKLRHFVQHFERLTRANLAVLPDIADVILDLNDHHDCIASHYADKQ